MSVPCTAVSAIVTILKSKYREKDLGIGVPKIEYSTENNTHSKSFFDQF